MSSARGSKAVDGEVLLAGEGSGDRQHLGEELVPGAVALTLCLRLDTGQKLGGVLVTEGGECVELLRPLVVGHVGLLDNQILDHCVGVLFGE